MKNVYLDTTSDFCAPGRLAAIAGDNKSMQTVWFVQVGSEERTNNKSVPISDDYRHVVGPCDSFYKCGYMEDHSTSRKGITYRMTRDKTVYVFKESFVYPYVKFKLLASGHYSIEQKDRKRQKRQNIAIH